MEISLLKHKLNMGLIGASTKLINIYLAIIDVKCLNQYPGESGEKKAWKLEEWSNMKFSASEESKKTNNTN